MEIYQFSLFLQMVTGTTVVSEVHLESFQSNTLGFHEKV